MLMEICSSNLKVKDERQRCNVVLDSLLASIVADREQITEDALVKEIPVEMCAMVNDEPQGHLQSSEHVKRIEEEAIGTFMGGKAKTPRFNGDKCTSCPTKKKMQDFWGDALEILPKAAKDMAFVTMENNSSLQKKHSMSLEL